MELCPEQFLSCWNKPEIAMLILHGCEAIVLANMLLFWLLIERRL